MRQVLNGIFCCTLQWAKSEEGLPYGAFCCSDCRTLRTVIMENLVQRSAYGMEGYGKFRMECRYLCKNRAITIDF